DDRGQPSAGSHDREPRMCRTPDRAPFARRGLAPRSIRRGPPGPPLCRPPGSTRAARGNTEARRRKTLQTTSTCASAARHPPQAVERSLRRLRLGAVGGELNDLLPGFLGAGEILFAERFYDPDVQQRLGVLRINLQRVRKLLERLVGLIRVVVANAEIRAH